MISYSQKQLKGLSFSGTKEWLLTDGDGGYASSTLSFMNTRRQHSLLTVSGNFPIKRFTLLNKLEEEVIVDRKSYMLGTNHYPDTIFPDGYKFLNKFVFDHFPQVTFDLDGIQIIKKILMPRGASSVFCHYENNSKKAVTLRLLPLISFRAKDSIRKAGDGFLVDELPDGVRIIADMNLPRLYLKLSQIYVTSPQSNWYYDFIYPHDAGLYDGDREDLYNIGFWETELEPGKGLTFAASTRDLAEFDYPEIETRYIESVEKARSSSGLPKRYVHLVNVASDHLVSSHAMRSRTIIEGYPYGSISTRSSFLSLNGIACASDRPNFEQEFLYGVVSNEVNGAFPSTVEENTFHINYGDPKIPLYLALALKRCAEGEENDDCLRRYLPILDEAAEIIMENNLGGRKIEGTSLFDVTGGKEKGLLANVENAVANALWYNLLRVIDESRSTAEAQPGYDEIAAEIESEYFKTFFEEDGRFKGMADGPAVMSDMAFPLSIPFSPLSQGQREKIFRLLAAQLFDSLRTPSLHAEPDHACNLTAIYLAEAGSSLPSCEEETEKLRDMLIKLFTLREFTECVNGLPTCGVSENEHYPRDISAAVVAGESIRIIRKLKFR